MKYSRKGHKDRNRHKNGIKRSGQARLVYVKKKQLQHPHHVKGTCRLLSPPFSSSLFSCFLFWFFFQLGRIRDGGATLQQKSRDFILPARWSGAGVGGCGGGGVGGGGERRDIVTTHCESQPLNFSF